MSPQDNVADIETYEPLKKLSPGELKDACESLFAFSEKEVAMIRLFIANVSALPKTTKELEQRLGSPAGSIQSSADKIVKLNQELAAWAVKWSAERIPVILETANDIALYSAMVEAPYTSLLELSRHKTDAAKGAKRRRRGDPLAGVQQHLRKLRRQAGAFAEKAATASDASTGKADELRHMAWQLGELSTDIHNTLTEKSAELDALNRDIANLEAEIRGLNKTYIETKQRADKDAKLVWIPFAGLVFAGKAIAELAKLKQTADKAKARYEALLVSKRQAAPVYAALSVLNTATGYISSVQEDLDEFLPMLGRMRGIWDAIAADLSDVQKTLARLRREKDPRSILLNMGIDTAVGEWKAIGEEAHAFAESVSLTAGQSVEAPPITYEVTMAPSAA